MPNRRDSTITSGDLETAHPFPEGRFARPEEQSSRGEPGSRGPNAPARKREEHTADEYTGVDPKSPLLPSMPFVRPGDQGG